MKFKLGAIVLFAISAIPATSRAQVPAGRWEIVHTSGDSAAQTDLYPGGFSTYLYSNGTGNANATEANSICVVEGSGSNVVPSWTSVLGETFTITITVDNLGLGPNVTFVYTGTYNPITPVTGDVLLEIPTISGTYYATGDASACSTATQTSPGAFVATFLPDLSSGASSGSLDATEAENGSPFDASVNTTINFTAPATAGQIAGTVSLGANPMFGGQGCFAGGGSVPNPLTIDSSWSNQAGILNTIYAQGFDPQGNPTTLVLQGYSANLYTPTTNTDATANQITSTEWAAGAAIGEDDPDTGGTQGIGTQGVANDGKNNVLVEYYNVVGGICDGAGGSDAPFHFLSGVPVPHPHRKHGRRKDHRRNDDGVSRRRRIDSPRENF